MELLSPSNQQARLLLTSSGLTQAPFKQTFLALLRARNPHGSPRVLYIPDALFGNNLDAQQVQQEYSQFQALLHAMGVFLVDACELRRTPPEAMRQRLQGADAVYVEQGNTFYLRHYMRTSGFDQLVPWLLREGVVYVGASSGSITAGASVRSAFWKGWDDPGYGQEWDLSWAGYDGLGLIPGGKSLFPHYMAHQHEGMVRHGRASLGHDLVVLGDDHAYVTDGRGEYIITAAGEVISLRSAASTQQLPGSPSKEASFASSFVAAPGGQSPSSLSCSPPPGGGYASWGVSSPGGSAGGQSPLAVAGPPPLAGSRLSFLPTLLSVH